MNDPLAVRVLFFVELPLHPLRVEVLQEVGLKVET